MRLGGLRSCLLVAMAAAGTGVFAQELSTSELVRQFEAEPVFYRQFEIAKAMVARNDQSVLGALAPWLEHDQRHLRGNAAYVFAKLGDPRGYETIVGILGDFGPRGEAPEGFPQGGSGDGSIPRLFNVEMQIRADRYFAVHLLGELKNPAAIPLFAKLLDDPDVNYKIAWALKQIGGDAAINLLVEALQVDSAHVRVSAIQALETLGARASVDAIRPLLNDSRRWRSSDPSVAEAAQKAIRTLEAR